MTRTTRTLRGRLVAACTLTLGLLVPTQLPAGAEPPGPVNAGNTFRWGWAKTDYAFKGQLSHHAWTVSSAREVGDQHGILTLEAHGNRSVTATENVPGHRTGRWEIRLRSRSYESRHADFRVLTQLVPGRGRDQHCGGRNIALESYRPGGHTVQHYVRDTPNLEYRTQRSIGLRDDQWHTFAVEVTRQRISWFVDAKVVSSEKRRDILSRTPLALRFTLQAQPGARMNHTRMQMDWARYWTLERPNQKSTKAPQLAVGAYGDAC